MTWETFKLLTDEERSRLIAQEKRDLEIAELARELMDDLTPESRESFLSMPERIDKAMKKAHPEATE